VSVQADCMWIRDLLAQAKTSIQINVLQPIVKFETTFAKILSDFYQLQSAMSATISEVTSQLRYNSCYQNKFNSTQFWILL